MNFATLDYAIFLIIVYIAYLLLPHRWQNYFLLIASYFFYAYWDWRFLSLILFSTITNYWIGAAIARTENPQHRKWYLWTAVIVGLSILGFFKYLGFLVDSTVDLLTAFGLQAHRPILEIILPVGISFYTFQTLSYSIDIYRKKLEPTRNILEFSLFVAFFPQLVAGPIERAKNLLPQIRNPRHIDIDGFSRGCFLILLGLFKKIVIADGVAGTVNSIFGMSATPTTLDIILATYLFTLQIYCDFSGYSDIARGTAKIMGFDLMTNFRNPLFAINPQDFWNRWHISLSSWLRDYLYYPLGGSRGSELKTHRNLFLTFFLSGVWHGAAWNFILWGIYQGILISAFRFWKINLQKQSKNQDVAELGVKQRSHPARFLQWFLVWVAFFQLVAYGRFLFRAESLEQVLSFTYLMLFDFSFWLSVDISLPISTLAALPLLLLLEGWQYATDNPQFYRQWWLPIRTFLYASLLYLTMMGSGVGTSDFIYFAF